jgi:P2 family phage contractile tail tube protein
MASERPRYIMRNATIWVNRISQIGQASEIGFPSLKRKMEKVFNGGMEVEIEVPMGYEAPDVSFKMTSVDPAVLTLFGLAIGVETEYMATAALVDDDGTAHSAVAYFRGIMSEVTPDSHKRGDKSEVEYKMSFRYYKLEIDGQPIYEVDPFEIKVAGQSQTQNTRRAMLVS